MIFKSATLMLASSALVQSLCAVAPQKSSDKIRVNQVGYFSNQEKTAAVQVPLSVFKSSKRWGAGATFEIIDSASGKSVFIGKLMQANYYPFSKEAVRLADFSKVTTPGNYKIKIGDETSYAFEVADAPYKALSKAALKMFYYFRCSSDVKEEFGGKWHRPFGIADDKVIIHESAASKARPAGTVVSAPGGWFDAGDYNKYTVNSGISTFSLMALHEALPQYTSKQNINIPESTNGVPDVLDQAYWNLKWLEQMQDPSDGGVYHRLSAKSFGDLKTMPHQYTKKRYMQGKNTSAALNFSAALAQASRVFAPYEKQFPGFSKRCLQKSIKAYQWAKANPTVRFTQPEGFTTGIYENENYSFSDEFSWAATELFITTLDKKYFDESGVPFHDVDTPIWTHVGSLGYLSLVHNRERVKDLIDMKLIRQRLTEYVDYLIFDAQEGTGIAYRMSNKRFEWGSNGFVSNQTMLTLASHLLTGEQKYLDLGISNVDYLLGKNPLNHCFITGFGSKSSINVHQRLCAADGIDDPIPGILIGGPNPWEVIWDLGPDGYPSPLPALSHIDHIGSFSTNEAAINWNSPLVYITGYLDAMSQNLK